MNANIKLKPGTRFMLVLYGLLIGILANDKVIRGALKAHPKDPVISTVMGAAKQFRPFVKFVYFLMVIAVIGLIMFALDEYFEMYVFRTVYEAYTQ